MCEDLASIIQKRDPLVVTALCGVSDALADCHNIGEGRE